MVRRHQLLSVSSHKTVSFLSVIRPFTPTGDSSWYSAGHGFFLVIMSVLLLVTIVHLQRKIGIFILTLSKTQKDELDKLVASMSVRTVGSE